jgi:hypothetical protein
MIDFLAPNWNAYPILIPSLLCQTSPRWRLRICNDSPDSKFLNNCAAFRDERIEIATTEQRLGNWGHPIRKMLLDELTDEGQLVVISNGDNYCFPNLVASIERCTEDFICWPANHSYINYKIMSPRTEYGNLDISMVAIRARICKEVGWKSFLQDADWLYLQECWQKSKSWKFLTEPMSVHN